MKVLIVEDDTRKADAVLALLKAEVDYAEARLARSYQSGLRLIQEWHPDLLVLDMSLPNYDAEPGQRTGKPRPLGGYEIMRKLRRQGIEAKSIVLTQLDHFGDNGQEFTFDDLRQKCIAEFPSFFLGSIYFSQSSSDWKRDLIQKISTCEAQKKWLRS